MVVVQQRASLTSGTSRRNWTSAVRQPRADDNWARLSRGGYSSNSSSTIGGVVGRTAQRAQRGPSRQLRLPALPGSALSELIANSQLWQQAYIGALGMAAGVQLGTAFGPRLLQQVAESTQPGRGEDSEPKNRNSTTIKITSGDNGVGAQAAGVLWDLERVWRDAAVGLTKDEDKCDDRTRIRIDRLLSSAAGTANEQQVRKPQASLQAVTASARQELLSLSLQVLRDHVDRLPDIMDSASGEEWVEAVGELLESCSHSVAESWLSGVDYLPSDCATTTAQKLPHGSKVAMLRATLQSALEDDESTTTANDLAVTRRTLHALVLHSLRFTPDDDGDTHARTIPFQIAAPAVVQDIVVVIADKVASRLLENIRQLGPQRPSALSGQCIHWPSVLHPVLASTRALERFCNEILLYKWWEANFLAVKAMYEDKYTLWGYNSRGALVRRSVSARRSRDVQQLSGLRQAVSVAIEAIDVSWPIVRALTVRLRSVMSWLLVTIIGHSLGLVGRGIQESLRRGGAPREGGGTEEGATKKGGGTRKAPPPRDSPPDPNDWTQGGLFAF